MPIRSILLIRLSAIGDIVLASGVVPALRQAYPRARIDWLAQNQGGGLLAGCRDLDRVLLWPRQEWMEGLRKGRIPRIWREGRELVRELRHGEYDLVLDMQGLAKSAVFAALSGGGRRIGLNCREGSTRLMHEVVTADNCERIAGDYKALLAHLGAEPSYYSLGLEPSRQDWSRATALLRRAEATECHIAVCPFTTRPQKHWPEEHWAALLPEVERISGLKPLLLGGPEHSSAGERIRSKAGGNAVNLAGKTSLPQSLALIQNADLVLGVDTGLTHMGMLSDRPAIALFGSTRPYLATDRETGTVLYSAYTCSPCKRRPICRNYPCMQAITPEQVLTEARLLLWG